MNLPITKRQEEMLSTIYNYIKDSGYPPTFEEMKESLNVSSNQSIIDLLNKLEIKKLIKKNEGTARSLTILPLGYEILGVSPIAPFIGVAHAGSPIETIQVDGRWEEVPGGLEKLSDELAILKITGDSMINAGINDGDKVLVQVKSEYKSGDIVWAQVDEESTIKRFMSEDKPPYLYLKPENPKYPNILFTPRVTIRGKVIHIIKNADN